MTRKKPSGRRPKPLKHRPKTGPSLTLAALSTSESETSLSHEVLTLQDEIRHTQRYHRSFWWAEDLKLRNSTIKFVCAGNLPGTIPQGEKGNDPSLSQALENLTLDSATNTPNTDSTQGFDSTPLPKARGVPHQHHPRFYLQSHDPLMMRSSSPVSSESSEEVVFRGRGAPDNPPTQTAATRYDWNDTDPVPWVHRSKPGIGWDPGAKLKARMKMKDVEKQKISSEEATKICQNSCLPNSAITFNYHDTNNPRLGPSKLKQSLQSDRQQEEDAAIADYIENIREQGQSGGLPNLSFDFHAMNLSLNDEPPAKSCDNDTLPEAAGDIRCIPEPFLKKEEEWKPIHVFEEQLGYDTDSQNEQNLSTELYSKLEITDEELALRLTKQEELGLGSQELLLFGGDDITGNLKSKKTRKKLPPTFDPSDEDIKVRLQRAFEADRKKKAQKKNEREELRSTGLLGKKTKVKPDLKMKYKGGMAMDQILEEIKTFLHSEHQSYSFPPMEKTDRAFVHSLVAPLNIKSKSIGHGNSRYTTLIKTSRTIKYDSRVFADVEARMVRRFFSRVDKDKKTTKDQSISSRAAVKYRDGEIVGANAPEIAADNKGRTMLEKMGWCSGTALGAHHNKGILEPVTHKVKHSKAGLG